MTKEQEQYLSDDLYLPLSYENKLVKQPNYKGPGEHSVKQLEEICTQFKEYCHQQSIIKQGIKKAVILYKFNHP